MVLLPVVKQGSAKALTLVTEGRPWQDENADESLNSIKNESNLVENAPERIK